MWDKIFSTANRGNSPLPSKNFSSLPKTLWNTEWFPVEDFSVLWDRKKLLKNRESSPLLCLKLFDIRNLSKNRSVLLRYLSELWDKNFSTEFSDIPILCINSCDTQKFSETPKCSPTKLLGTVWEKFSTEKRDTPLPLWYIKFFHTPTFVKHWRGVHEHFLHCDTKCLRLKNVVSPIKHKIFRYPNFFETMKGSSRNNTALWDQKLSTEERETPLFIHKNFRNQNFFKNSRIPSWYFSVPWDNIFSIEICDIPRLSIEFFDTRNFLYHGRVPRQNFLALWDENFSSKNRDTLLHKVLNSVVELMFVRTLWKLIWKQ